MPALYIVATPVGNLEDISLRAIRTLREVGLIAAEDTRRTKKLLNAYDIKTPLTSYHEHNKRAKLNYILERLREVDVALVSDAGMPGISDPGHELIVAAVQQSIRVVPVPGPSVVITAVAVSGLPTNDFRYIGFLPRKSGSRRRFLESVIDAPSTLVILESPHRLQTTLQDMLAVLGDRRMAVCRELTKLYEEVFRGTVSEALKHFAEPRGEFALVVEGKSGKSEPLLTQAIEKQLYNMKQRGMPAKEAVAAVSSETGLPKRQLYQVWTRLRGGDKK